MAVPNVVATVGGDAVIVGRRRFPQKGDGRIEIGIPIVSDRQVVVHGILFVGSRSLNRIKGLDCFGVFILSH